MVRYVEAAQERDLAALNQLIEDRPRSHESAKAETLITRSPDFSSQPGLFGGALSELFLKTTKFSFSHRQFLLFIV